MADSNFVDYVKVCCRSGKGGGGSTHFHRDKLTAKGGPDGGDGGRGGHIILRASRQLMTLIDFRYRQHFRAGSGRNGSGRNKTGAAGKDLILTLPIGTEVWSDEVMILDLTKDNQELTLQAGGDGGRGNMTFVSSTNRAPQQSSPGHPGSHMWIELRLKLLADIGLIGLPNAGKSTLLRALTGSKSKVGDYPFTTLSPQLGILGTFHRDIVIADLPGLIEGAHEGKGLGHRFLGHGERCTGLLHVIDSSLVIEGGADGLKEAYAVIRQELEAYTPQLAEKKETIVLTKSDLLTDAQKQECHSVFPEAFLISALSLDNIQSLKDFLVAWLPQKSSDV
jgi:GTP-binding protein